eukprot:9679930-Heterocapsa_arctica.AAC.1
MSEVSNSIYCLLLPPTALRSPYRDFQRGLLASLLTHSAYRCLSCPEQVGLDVAVLRRQGDAGLDWRRP